MSKAKRKIAGQTKEIDGQVMPKTKPEIAFEDEKVHLTISIPRKWKKKLMVCAIQLERDASDIVLEAIKPTIEPYVVQVRSQRTGGGEQRPDVAEASIEETPGDDADQVANEE